MNKMKNLVFATLGILALGVSDTQAAGLFGNFPTAGNSQYPSTLPLTGSETIPADTNLGSGLNPASELVTTSQLASSAATFLPNGIRNILIGGDFGTNPWQRGTSFTGINNTLTYTADRWFVIGGASSNTSVAQQTGSTDIIPGSIGSLRVTRPSGNSATSVITLGSAITSYDSVQLQGKTVEFSFWAKAGANYSATALQALVVYGIGANQSAANMVTGSWTNQITLTNQATTIGTTWTRYSAVATVPSTATQVGVMLQYTPTGTAGVNDWFEITQAQLAINPNAVAYNGSALATNTGNMLAYEFEPPSMVNLRALRYFWQLNETNGGYFAPGMVSSTNTERGILQFPVPMRAIPTCTFTSGGFKWNIAGTLTAVSSLSQISGTTASYLTIGDTAIGTAGGTAFLSGSAATGVVACNAEL